jgi:hypothetical protein
MSNPPRVHQLDEDVAPRLMHAVRHAAPASYLLVGEHARDARVAQAGRLKVSPVVSVSIPVDPGHAAELVL